jgi:hypothetical protein
MFGAVGGGVAVECRGGDERGLRLRARVPMEVAACLQLRDDRRVAATDLLAGGAKRLLARGVLGGQAFGFGLLVERATVLVGRQRLRLGELRGERRGAVGLELRVCRGTRHRDRLLVHASGLGQHQRRDA